MDNSLHPTIPRFMIAGQLTRSYTILPSGKALLDTPGGNVLYAAVGLAIWEPDPPPVIVARAGEDYPQSWLETFRKNGLDTRGIRILPEAIDLRSFAVFSDGSFSYQEDPVAHFSRLNLPFPKSLLGYRPPIDNVDSRTRLTPASIRQADLTSEILDASAAHLCPIDYLTHSLLPAVLRQAGFTTITLDPSPRYMSPIFWNDLPALLNGLTAFLPSEEEVQEFFHGRSSDLWEMAEALASYGCEMVVIKRGLGGQLVYDAASRSRWEIPAYPSNTVDQTGAGDAFCGGFLAGYRRFYDPVRAALHGGISASLAIEGHGPFYALDALPGLVQARLEALSQKVRKV